MPTSAFFSVLRDAAKIASSAADDLASQSVKMAAAADDIATMTGKAMVKTAGVAGDDLAVGAGQVNGVSPSRELPALWRIARGSFINKVWLSAILLLVDHFYPPLITVALLLGGLYLAFEGAEGLLEKFHPKSMDEEFTVLTEDEKVSGAIRTDLILSLEILVISLASIGDGADLQNKIGVLSAMSVLMTVLIYGLIALIIRLDDMGLAMARGERAWKRSLGVRMANAAPVILKALGPIGMVAMFAVAGGIFSHAAHISLESWPVAFAADIVIGLIVGLLAAAVFTVARKISKKSAA